MGAELEVTPDSPLHLLPDRKDIASNKPCEHEAVTRIPMHLKMLADQAKERAGLRPDLAD